MLFWNWIYLNFIPIFASDPFDCSPWTCGNEGWLIVNNQYKNYMPTVNGAPTCQDTNKTPFLNAINPIVCECPNPPSIAPFVCPLTEGSNTTLTLSCPTGSAVNDSMMATVLAQFDIPQQPVPLDTIAAPGQLLTSVPANLTHFVLLKSVDVSNNSITAVNQGDFNLTASVDLIDISGNAIQSIARGAFASKFYLSTSFSNISYLDVSNSSVDTIESVTKIIKKSQLLLK